MGFKQLLTNLFGKTPPPKKQVVIEPPDPPAPVAEESDDPKPKSKKLIRVDLAPEQQNELIVMIAERRTNTEIMRYFKDEYGIAVSTNSISGYRKSDKWRPLIKTIEDKYLADLGSVAGTHKRVRMERLDQIYETAIRKDKLKEAITAIEKQRVEIEGDSSKNVSISLNQFNMLSDEQLEEERKRVLSEIEKLNVLKKPKQVIDVEVSDGQKSQ